MPTGDVASPGKNACRLGIVGLAHDSANDITHGMWTLDQETLSPAACVSGSNRTRAETDVGPLHPNRWSNSRTVVLQLHPAGPSGWTTSSGPTVARRTSSLPDAWDNPFWSSDALIRPVRDGVTTAVHCLKLSPILNRHGEKTLPCVPTVDDMIDVLSMTVQRYAPEIGQIACRPFLRRTNDSYRIDETCAYRKSRPGPGR